MNGHSWTLDSEFRKQFKCRWIPHYNREQKCKMVDHQWSCFCSSFKYPNKIQCSTLFINFYRNISIEFQVKEQQSSGKLEYKQRIYRSVWCKFDILCNFHILAQIHRESSLFVNTLIFWAYCKWNYIHRIVVEIE